MIAIDQLSFGYDQNQPILQGVTMDIAPRRIHAILGKNGCGKSTLLQLMLGLLKPQQGAILLAGKPLNRYQPVELAKQVAFVPQLGEARVSLTVLEYLTLGRNAYMKFYQMPSQEAVAFAQHCGQRCNLGHLLHQPMTQLSGGERQLVMMAKALVQDTEVILLDEPTSALDLSNQRQVLWLLKELEAMGKTVVFTTHNPNHPLLLEAQVHLMKEGQMMGQGLAQEVLTVETLERLYGVKTREMTHGNQRCFSLEI